jgi:hypothetical protein
MANQIKPQGAIPKGNPRRTNAYVAGGTVHPGDFVTMDATGRVATSAATTALCGVAASYAAAAGDTVLVHDDPAQLFEVQSNGAEPAAQTAINLNYDIVATSANTTYRVSKHELAGSTAATTSTLPLKLVALQPIAGEDGFGSRAKCVVLINNHQLNSGTGAAGI